MVLDYVGCFAKAAGNVNGVEQRKTGLRDGLRYIYITLQETVLAFSTETAAQPMHQREANQNA